ncbi:hypothetical protein GGX14DRAFT_524653 [Mycena pura]|uniref:Transmembrane protein n=1 Tax=Mycena pura TaxID=153505 RepID=A0AAD6V2G7_9AGAR|nr:hypothetical protein GGX14DRAFT_524653 [Mycena pura]
MHARAPNYDSCDDINSCRTLQNIVWGCFTTIFACTWVSVHPNVPPPRQGWLALVWRRLNLMSIAIVAPELMVGLAARQLVFAWRCSREFEISLTHGFFVCMGGFVSPDRHPVVTKEQLRRMDYLDAVKEVPVETIVGKSKGDSISKSAALVQGLWFIAQCAARVAQRLPVTQLEVCSLAFAVVNIVIWLLWWGKPLDVPGHDTIIIGAEREAPKVRRADHIHSGLRDRATALLAGIYENYDPSSSNAVPLFWSISAEDNSVDNTTLISLVIECIVGAIFGAIHCAAWNSDFPSAEERWMWCICALLVGAIPVLVLILIVVLLRGNDLVCRIITAVLFLVLWSLYIISRFCLLVLPLTALRALPPGALVDVDWNLYTPHLW